MSSEESKEKQIDDIDIDGRLPQEHPETQDTDDK